MLARVFTATLIGLQPICIEVEVDGTQGIPGLVLIGLPSKAVDEARERITAALQNCGVRIRAKRTVINLAPADIPKTGSTLDLAIAVGLLKMYGEIKWETSNTLFIGELSLDGTLKPVRGALPLVLAAQKMGFARVVFPRANLSEVQSVRGVALQPLTHLREYIETGEGSSWHSPQAVVPQLPHFTTQFQDVRGQVLAKRALEVAAAGGHNVLLVGPPGAGKSMLARALPSILPPLTQDASLEVTTIYSVCGLGEDGLQQHPPFRNPHHSISYVGLVGGGSSLKPGEISLAHQGVLFLDEFPEFARQSIESLRQPLEEGAVRITRANGTATFPAQFMLVAAANPCPCGFYGSSSKPCQCTPTAREKYLHKLSGPILDRIDLHVQVDAVEISALQGTGAEESSAVIRDRVVQARSRQHQRHAPETIPPARLPTKRVQQLQRSPAANQLLITAAEKLQLSARSYFKVLKVARTIADLEGTEQIEHHHLAEALQYRLEKSV